MLGIARVLKKHTDELMAIPGVVGVAEGKWRDRPSVVVFVIKKDSLLLSRIPATLDGYPVRVEASGEFCARDGESSPPTPD